MTNDYRPRVMDFVKRWGPVLPVQISKELNTNILFAGAMLSELVSRNQVIVTSTKKGGSPYYYVKGQEPKFQGIASNLSGREKEAYEVLKEKKVVRDKESTPWLRVALRAISDFAVQLNVTTDNNNEIFWKWYLLDEKRTEEIIKDILKLKEVTESIQPSEIKLEQKQEVAQSNLSEKEQETITEQLASQDINRVSTKRKAQHRQKAADIEFLALEYFNERAIKIIEKQTVRKSKDSRFIVEIPSGIGNISYYVRAKSKVTITEDDLMLAFGEAKQRGLPALIITTGELSKKAKELLDTNLKGQLIFFRL